MLEKDRGKYMHEYLFYENIKVRISDVDWDYLCKNRFFTSNPTYEDLRAEFVSGTGITPNKPERWTNADSDFKRYIQELRQVRGIGDEGETNTGK